MRRRRCVSSRWLPAGPPKMPYSCCMQTRSTRPRFRKSASCRYSSRSFCATQSARGPGIVAFDRVVHGRGHALDVRRLAGDRLADVSGERGYAAAPRHIVADESNLAELGTAALHHPVYGRVKVIATWPGVKPRFAGQWPYPDWLATLGQLILVLRMLPQSRASRTATTMCKLAVADSPTFSDTARLPRRTLTVSPASSRSTEACPG